MLYENFLLINPRLMYQLHTKYCLQSFLVKNLISSKEDLLIQYLVYENFLGNNNFAIFVISFVTEKVLIHKVCFPRNFS